MWLQKGAELNKTKGNGLLAIAIDNEKGSQNALKWAADNLITKGQTIVLIHVVPRASPSPCKSLSLSLK